MTRFKTRSKVEVFSTREVASGSWYRAEIIHGNGHYYTIKYEDGTFCQVFDRVPRRAIRPCPPPLQVLDWASGDVIEVFHHFSWKMATVLRALQTGWLLVRLLGSSHELEVSEVDARPRVFLHHDEWNVVGKGSSNSGKRQNAHMEASTSISLKNSYFPCIINNGGTQEVKDGSKSLKRKFKSCYPESGAQNKRVRVKGKDRRRNKQTSTILQPGANSITSSVASCSMSAENTCEIPRNFLTEENDDYNSDAESFCHNQSEVPSDENLSEEIHRIELHGYRSILGALYASGPLSWEQETLLTDLRNSLHITNDEHLMELRSLVSGSS